MLQRFAQEWSRRTRLTQGRWRWIGYLLTLAAVVYLVYTLAKGNIQLNQVDLRVYGWALLASLGFYLVSLVIQFFIWTRLISFHRRATWQDVEIYSRMVLMRSLPGGAWHWVGRISMYSGATEVPTRVVVLGNFLEWALLILVGAAIFVAFLPYPVLSVLGCLLLAGAAIALAVSWQPPERGWLRRLAEAFLWVILDGFVWLAGAAILYSFTGALAGFGRLQPLQALYVWTFSGSLSMLIIFLPSSLGVREISLVALLQPTINPSIALLIALLIRIVFIFADIFWGLTGWLISQMILWRHGKRGALPEVENPAAIARKND